MRGVRLGGVALSAMALMLAAAPVIAAGGEDDSEAGQRWRVGVDAMALDRAFELGGSDYGADGTLAGLYGAWQHASGVGLEGRILAGGAEYEIDGAGPSSDTAAYADFEATWSFGLPDKAHLYGGVGTQYYTADFGDGGKESSEALYLPLGVSKEGALHGGWWVVMELEGQLVLAGRHEVELPNNGGSADFEHYGGAGVEVSARFGHPDSAVEITPYFRHLRVADSQSEQIGGTSERVSDLEHSALGVRFTARF